MVTVMKATGFTDPPVRPQLKLWGQETSREEWESLRHSSYRPSIKYRGGTPACYSPRIPNRSSLHPHCRYYFAAGERSNQVQIFDHAQARLDFHMISFHSPLPSCVKLFRAISRSSEASRHSSHMLPTQFIRRSSTKGPIIPSSDIAKSFRIHVNGENPEMLHAFKR